MLTTTLRSQYYTSIAKTLRAALQEHLQDFSDFLLTKEATHFTILSFLPAYPGLVHFIHVQDGIMIAPRIVDLNEMNQQHGQVLLEAGQKYYEEWQMEESKLGLWDWPSVSKLQALVKCSSLDDGQEDVLTRSSKVRGHAPYGSATASW